MPIDDEGRRFCRTKGTANANPQTSIATEGELEPKVRVQESLQRLQEMLLSQRHERADFLAAGEKRIEANERTAQRARDERNEKYERLQQAFERVNKWKVEQEAEAAGEKLKGVRGANPNPSHPCAEALYGMTDPRKFRGRWVSSSGGKMPPTTR